MPNRLNKYIWSVLAVCVVFPLIAQEENADIREGNKYYKANKFTEAEIAYRKGLLKNPQSTEAKYNLGNALFRQEKYAEALEQYQKIVPTEKIEKEKLAANLHNMGNALLMQKKVAESIEAYKHALKVNPNDDDTRYNLALAKHLLKNQQNQDQNQDQNKDQNKDDQRKEQQQPENNQEQQKQDNSKEEQQTNPDEMSKDKAEQILEALMQDEHDTMEKAKKLPKASKRVVEKDW